MDGVEEDMRSFCFLSKRMHSYRTFGEGKLGGGAVAEPRFTGELAGKWCMCMLLPRWKCLAGVSFVKVCYGVPTYVEFWKNVLSIDIAIHTYLLKFVLFTSCLCVEKFILTYKRKLLRKNNR